MKKLLLSILLFSVLPASIFAQIPAPLQPILKNISPDKIKATMSFLADDLVEGRQPGTRGFAIASKYMETQLMGLGLKPGNGNSFIQQVPLQKGTVDESGSSLTLQNAEQQEQLEYGKQFIISPYFAAATSGVAAPLVFVGFGVSAPEFKYDDYANIDVKGKIVVYISDAPSTFPSNERAFYNTADVKYNEAIKRGAVGIISFSLPSNKRTSWDALVRRTKQGSFKWVDKQGMPANSYPAIKAAATFNNAYLPLLFVHAPETIQKIIDLAATGKSMSFPLNISADMRVKTLSKSIAGSNVVAVLEGSDPKLKSEYVVYSAHLDHFGIGVPVKGDSIYNGAHDDASGNGILLEIARAYCSLAVKPKRSVIFAVVTGEESGLLGSDYFHQ